MDIESTDRTLLIDSSQTETPLNSDSVVVTNSTAAGKGVVLYGRRWYILVLFSFICFTQGCIWNTWGPLANSALEVFRWESTTIALMNNWGCIAYLVASPLFAWIMDVKGMRWASVITGVLVTSGAGLRCITLRLPTFTWLTHVGQFLNGLAGPVVMGGTPVISTVWFPQNQRTSATAFATVMGGMGQAVSFIIGPLMVPQCNTTQLNISHENNTCKESIKHGIKTLMYAEFGFAALITLLILIYFPTRPPTPPSLTASLLRTEFIPAIKQLFRHKKFWMLGLAYAIPLGVMNAWTSVLDIILKPLGINESTAGWIGFYCTLAGQVSAMAIGIFADVFARRMRFFLISSYSLATAALLVFILVYMKVIPYSIEIVYVSVILIVMFLFSAIPLFYELVCESTYPIAEGVTNTLLTLLNNIAGGIFFFVLMKPGIGTAWMNWCLLGCTAVSLPVFCLYKERYGRLDIDTYREVILGPDQSDERHDGVTTGSARSPYVNEDGFRAIPENNQLL